MTSSILKNQDANVGDFVMLVKLLSENEKEFHYLAVCQRKINDDKLVTIMKKYREDCSIFKTNKVDQRFVSNKDIVHTLEQPQIKSVGVRSYINFRNMFQLKKCNFAINYCSTIFNQFFPLSSFFSPNSNFSK